MNFLYDDERSYGDEDDICNHEGLSSTAMTSSDLSSSQSSINYVYRKSPLSPRELSPGDGHKPRKSLRDNLVRAVLSPARTARTAIASPGKRSNRTHPKTPTQRQKLPDQKLRKELKSWRAEFDLPADISREEAMAVILCRELEMMDL